MSTQPQKYPKMTIEEYFALEEANPEGRYEYIDGYVRDLRFLLMSGGTNSHSAITMNIGIALGIALRAQGKPCTVFSPDVQFALSKSKYVHPDVSVSCDDHDESNSQEITSPSLVVEVLSPSTEGYDHMQKLQMYSVCSSIQHYMLVDTKRAFIEVYHRLPDGSMNYRMYQAGETIPLNGLGIAIAVDDCYLRVTFPDSE